MISPQNRLTTCAGRKSPCKRDMTRAGSCGSRGSDNRVPLADGDISKVSNWLIKLLQLAATDDSYMGAKQQVAAVGWTSDQKFNNKDPLPDDLMIPQYVHGEEKDNTDSGRFDIKLPWVTFEWKQYWRYIAQWKDNVQIIQGTRASGSDLPDFCFCTHDDTPDTRVKGDNEHFFVFFWAGSDDSLPFTLRCTQSVYIANSKPVVWTRLSEFKAPSMASNKPTYRIGTVARTVTHCTAGPAARSGQDGTRPAPKRPAQQSAEFAFQEFMRKCGPHAWMHKKIDEPPDTQATTVDMQARPAISSVPVVTGCQPLQNPLHQSPRASGPQTDTNQETTVDNPSEAEQSSESQGEADFDRVKVSETSSDSEADYYAAGQGCGTNPKLCLAIYLYIDVYLCIDIYTAGYYRHA